MKLNLGLIRKFSTSIAILPADARNIIANTPMFSIPSVNEIDSFFQQYLQSNISVSAFKTIWGYSGLATMFSSWLNVYTLTESPDTSYLATIKEEIRKKYSKHSYYILTINRNPRVDLVMGFAKPRKSLQDKAALSGYYTDYFYILPQLRLLLTKVSSDTTGFQFEQIIKTALPNVANVKFRALELAKIFSNEQIINRLTVRAVHEITGFSGLDNIIFEGDHVKEGIMGLHRRQDIRVHLDEIGPKVQVFTPNIEFQIGTAVKIKNIEGLKVLQQLLLN